MNTTSWHHCLLGVIWCIELYFSDVGKVTGVLPLSTIFQFYNGGSQFWLRRK